MSQDLRRLLLTMRQTSHNVEDDLLSSQQEVARLRTQLQAAEHKLSQLSPTCAQLRNICDSLLRSYLSNFFSSVSSEILLLIFEELIEGFGWLCGQMEYDEQRAQAPFTIAAVCRKWRRLAISTSYLWSYYGIPSEPKRWKYAVSRLRTLEARSSSAPIDVVFRRPPLTVIIGSEFNDDGYTFSDLVNSLSTRWRRVEWSARRVWEQLTGIRGPTPELRALFIEYLRSSMHAEVVTKNGLSLAPKLKTLRLMMDNVDAAWQFDRTCSTPSQLSSLIIHGDQQRRCGIFIHSSRANLRELSLTNMTAAEFDLSSGAIIALPLLTYLVLSDVNWMAFIDAPSLNNLYLEASTISTANLTLKPCPHLRSLSLFGNFTRNKYSDIWAQFRNVEQLNFRFPSSTLLPTSDRLPILREGFLRFIADQHPSIWPALRSIRFAKAHNPTGPDNLSFNTDDLLFFARSRNTTSAQSGPNDVSVARLEDIVFEDNEAPAWLVAELKQLTIG